MKFYKVLNEDGSCRHGGTGKWYLPHGKRPGKWMPPIKGELIPCQNGYHLVTIQQVFDWFGPAIYEAEGRGERENHGDKWVFRQARLPRRTPWDARIARLFAADCAGHVLPLYERRYPNDCRPRDTIKIARLYANGKASAVELAAAAAAAWGVELPAARAAAWGADWVAAGDAAGDAMWAAGSGAARNKERRWQIRRLREYLDGKRGTKA